MFPVRDNFFLLSENEAGMKPKTVVTDIPLNFDSTYILFCSTYGGDIMKYRYVIVSIVAGTDYYFLNFSVNLLMDPANI